MKIATETTITVEKFDGRTGLWFTVDEFKSVEDAREQILKCMKTDRALARSGRYQIVKEAIEVYYNLEDAIWGESQNAEAIEVKVYYNLEDTIWGESQNA